MLPTESKGEIYDQLRNLNGHNSMGPDEMRLSVLRDSTHLFVKALSMKFQKSWQFGKVPGDQKKRNILLIFKRGRKKN